MTETRDKRRVHGEELFWYMQRQLSHDIAVLFSAQRQSTKVSCQTNQEIFAGLPGYKIRYPT